MTQTIYQNIIIGNYTIKAAETAQQIQETIDNLLITAALLDERLATICRVCHSINHN